MDKNFHYERQKIRLPEYGRHISQMVDYLMTIEDRELRNAQARVVIGVMGNLNPVLRDTTDFAHKLWDHLFIISGFRLDVDSPYPKPSSEALLPKPDRISYPTKRIAYKQYGKHIEEMLECLAKAENDPQRLLQIVYIVKYMRAKFYEYNQEYPNNEVILNDIRKMTKNSIILDENIINNAQIDHKQAQIPYRNRKNFPQPGQVTAKLSPRSNKMAGKYRSPNRVLNK